MDEPSTGINLGRDEWRCPKCGGPISGVLAVGLWDGENDGGGILEGQCTSCNIALRAFSGRRTEWKVFESTPPEIDRVRKPSTSAKRFTAEAPQRLPIASRFPAGATILSQDDGGLRTTHAAWARLSLSKKILPTAFRFSRFVMIFALIWWFMAVVGSKVIPTPTDEEIRKSIQLSVEACVLNLLKDEVAHFRREGYLSFSHDGYAQIVGICNWSKRQGNERDARYGVDHNPTLRDLASRNPRADRVVNDYILRANIARRMAEN